MKSLFLDIDVCRWPKESCVYFFPDCDDWDYPNTAVEYVEKILNESSISRENAIVTLKRAAERRKAHISSIYNLRKLPSSITNGGLMEKLNKLNIVKPIMMKKLHDLRNAVEHAGKPPPTLKACQEISEFVWYFAQSTEHLYWDAKQEIELADDNIEGGLVNIRLDVNSWNFTISGKLHQSYVIQPSSGTAFLSLDCKEIRSESEWILFDGLVRGTEQAIEELAIRFFRKY